jgi:isopentenyl-diphosphate delta-isomerase
MGIRCELKHCGFFIYRAALDNGLIEHELDHVFVGTMIEKNAFNINPSEAKNAKWMSITAIKIDLKKNPAHYSSWLQEAASVAHLF